MKKKQQKQTKQLKVAVSKPAQTPKPAPKPARRAGLGRGLDALIGAAAPAPAAPAPKIQSANAAPAPAKAPAAPSNEATPRSAATETQAKTNVQPPEDALNIIREIPPLDIERCPWQPRSDFNEESLNELAESIKANGVIQPLICRTNEKGKIELIAGERRLRAAVAAGLKKVPVVMTEASNRKAAEMAVVENIQRRDLNIIEEAEGYNQLIAEFNLTQQEVAERVGKSRPGVANALRLLELPDEVKQLLSQNVISPGHAKVLLGVEDQKERIILARSIVDEGLSVRALEQKIEKRNKPVAEKRTGRPDLPESYVRDLADKLHTYLGCAVRLYPGVTHPNGRHTKGVLEIDFFDNDDLDRIISVIGLKVD